VTELDENLLPQHSGGADLPEWAYLPEGKPEEFGFPADSHNHQKRQMWNRQEAFLAAYRKCDKIGKAAEAVGLTRWAVDYWMKHDIFCFHRRIEAAHEDYCEQWEQGMDDRLENPQGNRGSDILYMFKMKAERPEKYRENVQVVGVEPVREMLDRLTEMAARRLEQERRELEQSSVEGEYRDLGEADQKEK
jgi:hypothetical protein